MDYDLIVTRSANEDISNCIYYLLYEKKSPQAASNLLNDYDATLQQVTIVAESLKYCDNPKLRELGYRRINFGHLNYFILYRVVENIIYVERIFHGSQDYENKMI